jgi:hypothetical protein
MARTIVIPLGVALAVALQHPFKLTHHQVDHILLCHRAFCLRLRPRRLARLGLRRHLAAELRVTLVDELLKLAPQRKRLILEGLDM